MSDGYIKIDTKVDQTGLDKGLNETDKKLKGGTKGLKDYAGNIAKVGVAAGVAGLAIKKAADIVNDLTDAYKAQAKAETQLESAARNNPLLNDASVQVLKDYASQLQAISTTGDEELLPFMGQLAAAGRTQDEIMQIMSASLDIAATGTMSLDGAVRNLNKSFGGYAGELGEAIPEIKALTSEELKQGGAVKLLAERYKGMAAEVARNTGTAEQLANAFGDLKEQIGQPFEETIAPIRTFFKGIIEGWTNALSKLNEYKRAQKALKDDPANLEAQLTVEKQLLKDMDKEYVSIVKQVDNERQMYGVVSGSMQEQLDTLILQRQAQLDIIDGIQKQIYARETLANAEEEAARSKATTDAAETDMNKKALDHYNAVVAAREKNINAINLQADAEGIEADQLEIINAYVSSYVSLINESNGLISASNPLAQSLLDVIKQMTEEYEAQVIAQEKIEGNIEKIKTAERKALDELKQSLASIEEELDPVELLKRQRDKLDADYEAVLRSTYVTEEEKYNIYKEFADKRQILNDNLHEAEKIALEEEVALRQQKTVEMLTTVNEFANQYQQYMSSIVSMINDRIANESEIETAALKKQYDEGLISEEQFQEKKAEIDKEASKKKYDADMWEWGANLLSAATNTALAAVRALAEGGPFAGPLLAAMITALGGAQIAVMLGNKPIPPAFATGGIIPGSPYTGDNTLVRGTPGEMIWNAAQQRALWEKVKDGDWGSSSPNIQVYNQMANEAKVETRIKDNDIIFMIDKTVSKGMAEGKYNPSYRTMQNGLRGTRYTS
jgi:hypothetical protein